ncbi:hypothetical protein BDV36DRAFT_257856 [Aspergillus pseudocaelatus]|uniref:Uncharacterized protein n=1 Tax=Aspergillus pseudocaelatus TaxID=1825620 RepID=A0ABQ6WJJ4_9EURO|nr:hypothetical protein BDV36DRAFT_257856 [Aspergillus pseudocaelatus]
MYLGISASLLTGWIPPILSYVREIFSAVGSKCSANIRVETYSIGKVWAESRIHRLATLKVLPGLCDGGNL